MIPLGEMSPYVKAAFLATEDKRFTSTTGSTGTGPAPFGPTSSRFGSPRVLDHHHAAGAEHLGCDISGRDKSLGRKLREAHVALEIERKYPKTRFWRST